MKTNQQCPLCKNKSTIQLYQSSHMPVFQNKIYKTELLAKQATTGNIELVTCKHCAFVFNAAFDPNNMSYNAHYENEQGHSVVFQEHLSEVMCIFERSGMKAKKLIEVGCGKGFFLEKLVNTGFDVTGFDPAYIGHSERIIKDYFSEKYQNLSGDVIILRHVLEHIQSPLDFLHIIAKANSYRGQIYIEVPTFDWIIENKAFWDIFYEHCNYFTLTTLSNLFHHSTSNLLFNNQYMYLIANLKDLKKAEEISLQKNINLPNIENWSESYEQYIQKHPGSALWGASAKGVTFANLLDPDKYLINCLIDINPLKQNKYIAKTGHAIIPPEKLNELAINNILVMNDNYFAEIKSLIKPSLIELIKLSSIH